MKLIVKNFGAIKESVIDLSKRYYFFVGYNNTGKTYLAKLIYEIFNADTLNEFSKLSKSRDSVEEESGVITLNELLIKKLLDEFASYLKTVVIPKSLNINADSQFILKDLDVKFDFDFEKDVLQPSLNTGISLGIQHKVSLEKSVLDIYSLKKEENSSDVQVKYLTDTDIYENLPTDIFDKISENKFKKQIKSLKEGASKSFNHSLLNLLLQNDVKPFFLPANRIFILENSDELVAQDKKRKAEFSESLLELLKSEDPDKQEKLVNFLSQKSQSNHTTHIDYLISEISELRNNRDENFIRNGNGFYSDLILKLEAIMGGKIVMDKAGSISDWVEKFKIHTISDNEKPIQMYLASSSVNQLGTLLLYLKYWAKTDKNFLLIDEPEENLHPESQIKLINLLLEFGKLNNRVLLTTHSPLLAEIINNYLVLGQLEDNSKIANDLELVDVGLKPADAGIYYFNGEVVTEHKVGSYGTIFSSFKEAQDKIYSAGEYLGELMFKQNKSK